MVHKVISSTPSPSTDIPVLTEREREAVVVRTRAKVFELLNGYDIDVAADQWPLLEFGLQLRINGSPELQRRLWSQPEEVIEELMRTPWTNEEVAKLFPNEVEN